MYTETLNPTPTNEKLMLLKGKREDLANIAITPGAIYFTTDYPGIYVDFAAEGTEGSTDYKPAKRARMGDVTVVNSLSELKDLAAASITNGQKLGKDTLYYAKDKNVLCIYDEDEGKFVWVNDISALDKSLKDLADVVDGLGTDLEDLSDLVGIRPEGSTATVFGTIALEESRAKEAEKGLQDQIDAIAGEDGGSISELQEQIDDINEALTGTGGLDERISDLETTVTGTGGHESRLDTIEEKLNDIEDEAQVNIIEEIEVTIDGKSDPSVSDPTDKKVTITLPKDLTKYDGDNVLGGIADDITDINTAITNLKGTDYKDGETVHGNAEAIADIESEITSIKGTNWGVSMSPSLMDLFGYMNDISEDVSDIEDNIDSIETDIATLDQKIDTTKQEVETYTDEQVNQVRADLSQEINDNLAAADAMTFRGGVGFKTGMLEPDLPTVNVSAGDTYVIQEGAESLDGIYHAGDMMIAKYDQPLSKFKQTIIGSIIPQIQYPLGAKAYYVATPITVAYTEYIDEQQADYLGMDPGKNEGVDHRGHYIVGCGYLANKHDVIIPVLYTNNVLQSPPQGGEIWEVDYLQPYCYIGQEEIDGTIYDKWEYTEYNETTRLPDLTQACTRYYYTDVVVDAAELYPLEDWTHVKTGYDKVHEATLNVLSDAGSTITGNTMALFSHTGTKLGSVEFVSTSTNLEITKTAGQNGQFSFNLVWGTF